MTPTDIYGLALAWGLAGGFSHCIGMCGVFVVSYAGINSPNEQRRFAHPERHALFHAGRLVSLGVLGTLGGVIGALGHRYAALESAFSIVVGVLMLGLALGMAGVFPRFRIPEPDILGAGGGRGRRLFVRVLKSHSVLRPLMIGLCVGLLPCGLTYNALMATFTLTPWRGALLMLCFGLGTVPGLLALGLFGGALFGGILINLRFRRAMTFVSAAFMAILGLAFLWRGFASF
jgi:sulfite exporter TauE/SafE